MQIEIFNFAKEPNSTKQPSAQGRVVNCVLKDDCSVMNPVFLLNSWQMTDNYLKWGSRYYWIEDIVIKSKDHAELHCREDVLASFKSYIGSSSQYILRSAHSHTAEIVDMKYPILGPSEQIAVPFTSFATLIKPTGGCFIIGVNNGQNAVLSGGITYYLVDETMITALFYYMYAGSWLDLTETNISLTLQKELINPMQYIASITYIPLALSDVVTGTSLQNMIFGWWDSGVQGYALPATYPTIRVFDETVTFSAHPQAAARGKYMNCRPFTDMWLQCWCFGSVPIDPSFFATDKSMKLVLAVDLMTGAADLIISNGVSDAVVGRYQAQFGVPVQVSQIRESIIGAVSEVAGAAVSASYGNYLGVGKGIINAVESLLPQLMQHGGNGSRSQYNYRPTLYINRKRAADDDNSHLGRPLCVRGRISNYPGYCEVENADIDFACNYSELTEIKSFMEGGFYYE